MRVNKIKIASLLFCLSFFSVVSFANAQVAATSSDIVLSPDPDITPPVITILGDNPAHILAGSSYVDAGATAEDYVDGDIVVSSTSTVVTTTAGTYSVIYSANS